MRVHNLAQPDPEKKNSLKELTMNFSYYFQKVLQDRYTFSGNLGMNKIHSVYRNMSVLGSSEYTLMLMSKYSCSCQSTHALINRNGSQPLLESELPSLLHLYCGLLDHRKNQEYHLSKWSRACASKINNSNSQLHAESFIHC